MNELVILVTGLYEICTIIKLLYSSKFGNFLLYINTLEGFLTDHRCKGVLFLLLLDNLVDHVIGVGSKMGIMWSNDFIFSRYCIMNETATY